MPEQHIGEHQPWAEETHYMEHILDRYISVNDRSPVLDALKIDCGSMESFLSTIDPSFVSADLVRSF